MVKLIKKWNADWFEGEYQGEDGVKRGVFPSNHVEIVVDTKLELNFEASEAEIQSVRYGMVNTEEPGTIGYVFSVLFF